MAKKHSSQLWFGIRRGLLGAPCSAGAQGRAGNTGRLRPWMAAPELGLGLRATQQKGLELLGFMARWRMLLPVVPLFFRNRNTRCRSQRNGSLCLKMRFIPFTSSTFAPSDPSWYHQGRLTTALLGFSSADAILSSFELSFYYADIFTPVRGN